MKLLDMNVIHKHLRDLGNALIYLKSKSHISEREITADFEQRLAIERAFHLAIQNTIDIGNHILAASGINDVETYADIPEKLAKIKIISPKLSKNLSGMAKFRNVLVHDYIKIESKRLVSFLRNNLSDFSDFSKAVIEYISKSH